MIGVDKIEDIRRMWRRGVSVADIARAAGVSEPTVRKYRDMEDLSPEPPRRTGGESELLAPYAGTIDRWLADDARHWRRQRHTAVRVYVRLRDEEGYDGSYSTVQRYVRRRRGEMAREADQRDAQGFLQLDWLAGECQVDFGQADSGVRGALTRGHYLTVSFPHPDVGLTQVFWGEAAECVREGLAGVLAFVGGVPARAVLDNATEVGRRVCGEVRTSELFRLFAAHYGLGHALADPYSGNEKGNVENEVGCHRRDAFVPVPSFHDVRAFDRRLLADCLDMSDKPHYRLGTPEPELFEEDRAALRELPPAAFSCARWEVRRCSKQGVFTMGGVHRYSAGPAYARRGVDVALGAFDVTVVDQETGEVVATYEREWGDAPADSSDPTLQLKLLCMRPAGWRDGIVRMSLPGELVAHLDGEDAPGLGRDLRILRDEAGAHGFASAVEAMAEPLSATGGIDAAAVGLSAARIASGEARREYDEDVDLGAYDRAFGLAEGGAGDAAWQQAEVGGRGPPPRVRACALHILRLHRRVPRQGHPGPARRLHVAARGRAVAQGARQARAAPQAGGVPRPQDARGLRLAQRQAPRRLGRRRDAQPLVRGRGGGPRVLREDGQGQVACLDRPWHGRRGRRHPRAVLPDRAAGARPREGEARRHARQGSRGRREGPAGDPGRVRPRALRRGRRAAALPGHIRQPRVPEHRVHHQRGVLQVGHGPRGRRAGRGDRRQGRAPRQARGVRRAQPQAGELADAREGRRVT